MAEKPQPAEGSRQGAFDFSAPPDPTTHALVIMVAEANKTRFLPGFPRWLDQNYAIWSCFRREADALRARGFKHYAARTIVEWIRHETVLQEVAGDFKINNNAVPDLSRLYLLLDPAASDFFHTRGRY